MGDKSALTFGASASTEVGAAGDSPVLVGDPGTVSSSVGGSGVGTRPGVILVLGPAPAQDTAFVYVSPRRPAGPAAILCLDPVAGGVVSSPEISVTTSVGHDNRRRVLQQAGKRNNSKC